jgi:hypothetical protein
MPGWTVVESLFGVWAFVAEYAQATRIRTEIRRADIEVRAIVA